MMKSFFLVRYILLWAERTLFMPKPDFFVPSFCASSFFASTLFKC